MENIDQRNPMKVKEEKSRPIQEDVLFEGMEGEYLEETQIYAHEYARHEHEGLALDRTRLLELFGEFRKAEERAARKHRAIYRIICRGILELIRRGGSLKSKEAYDSISEWINQDSSKFLNAITIPQSNGPSSNV